MPASELADAQPAARAAWLPYVLPLAIFMVVGSFEPGPAEVNPDAASWLTVDYRYYPVIYTAKILLTSVAAAWAWQTYRRFPLRISPLALVVGVAGAGVWIALCQLRIEAFLLPRLGLSGLLDQGQRSAFNPLEQMDAAVWARAFLGVRFFGLVLLIPLVEEFFLRGFLMRWVSTEQWWRLPLGQVSRLGLVVGTAVPALMHPAELIAACVWFSAVSWLMLKTQNIWDCVAAHVVTNLLLGLFVLGSGQWHLM